MHPAQVESHVEAGSVQGQRGRTTGGHSSFAMARIMGDP
jgi:hypothetical protein